MSQAWYHGSREQFLAASHISIADQLAGRAASESLEIEAYQNEEWRRSIDILQKTLDKRIPILREALLTGCGELVKHVILEFDFRRRGLRMDCLLLGDGVIFVIEFKRTKILSADRDQVMTYAVNLVEFHGLTQQLVVGEDGVIIVPVISLTEGIVARLPKWPGLGGHSWSAIAQQPLECDRKGLSEALRLGFAHRRANRIVCCEKWLDSPFRPSSSILDATLSLYGNHDVSAIMEHAAPKAEIEASVKEIRAVIENALEHKQHHVVFLSGAPGAGKTLVGLDLVMRGNRANESVFVTGNAPLVEVLNEALKQSYKSQGKSSKAWAQTGYRRKDARFVTAAANYKIVKAHNFLGARGRVHSQADGRVLVFDEAQRTYAEGRVVLGQKLADHEADLILDVQREVYPEVGAVVIALIGHNQAINRGEMGITAWLDAIERKGWSFSIADETLNLGEVVDVAKWVNHPRRSNLKNGHLRQSMRYYRNSKIEEWVGAALGNQVLVAKNLAENLSEKSNSIYITRSLAEAKKWAKSQTIGNERSGIVASGQARRLAAEGLFVDLKPDIAKWMLAPSSDIRSSNALETVQNQFQVQGLELDYCIVCWDADLRRENDVWSAYKLSGAEWKRDPLTEVAKNSYRVLLTRARKGMVIFVPEGDLTESDFTRKPDFYNGVWDFLVKCGCEILQPSVIKITQ
jgi:hypothetical protein